MERLSENKYEIGKKDYLIKQPITTSSFDTEGTSSDGSGVSFPSKQ